VPPPPIAAPGTDPVSAAINETLPVIESPVIDGLRDAKTALTMTGSNIATAAGMYADTDERLGARLSQDQFLGASEEGARGADQRAAAKTYTATASAAADQPPEGETPSTPGTPASPLDSIAPQLAALPSQLGQMTGPMGTLSQSMQGVMSSVQGAAGSMPAGGPASAAQLTGDGTTTDQPAGQAQLVDESVKTDNGNEQQPEALAEGAAPGEQSSEGVPVQPLTPGRPEAAPSGIEL
jgi:hypothetical protein